MEYKRIEEITSVVTGGTPSTGESIYWDKGDIPWLQSGCCQNCDVNGTDKYITQLGYDNSSAKLMPPNTVMIALTGATAGKVGYLNFEACGNQSITGILPCDSINPRYLFYYLLSKREKILTDCIGGAQPHISQGYVKNVLVPILSLEKQKEIVAILSELSNILTKRRKEIELLDTLIKSRFVEMFGDLEKGNCVYPIKKLNDLSIKISDGVHAKPQYTESGKPFLSVVNINKGVVDFTDCKYVSDESYQEMVKSTNPRRGDVLYTKVGATYGIPAYVDTDRDFCLYVSVCLIKPRHEIINAKFLAIQMSMPFIKHQADKRIRGIGVPDLHLNQIKEFDIICPEMTKQNLFVDFVQQVDKLKATVQKSLEETQTLFDSLMQEYFG